MKRFVVLIIMGVLLTIGLLSGCAGGTVVSCAGSAHNVHQSKGTPSDMVGKVTGTCNAAVSITGYVEIQKRSASGSWYRYKRTSFTLVTVSGKTFTRQAATHCARGTYRTYSYVKGTYKGQSEVRRSTSGTTTNPCA